MATSLGVSGERRYLPVDLDRPLPAVTPDPAVAEALRVDGPRELSPRPPATAIRVLLPVWGEEYIGQFLEYSLPTLLAPGNIPALAKALPTHFVFLTRARHEAGIRAHPACERLTQVSTVEFLPIDDLITSGNHSTTITLAYARALRSTGPAMLETGFFFLVSDYIMADGSLDAVWARIKGGASAVQVGNFQLEEETAEPWLRQFFNDAGAPVALSPREVMRRALGFLHPATAANIVNFPLCHNVHTNRLLWRVDNATLIGRFYLLHMICIRPELTDFVVGSSCDYSFVPEMCPSGNVVTITDSDDYLVVELQPRGHEEHFLRLGPNSVEALAESLSEWTTAGHRANAQQTIVFHAEARPAGLSAALAEADDLVGKIAVELASPPQPHRDHPYWLGAIAAYETAVAERDLREPLRVRAMRWVRGRVFGRVPEVTRAHPRWKDFRLAVDACRALVAESPRLIIAANHSTPFNEWLHGELPGTVQTSLRGLLRRRPVLGAGLGDFDACVIELVDNDITRTDEVLRLIVPLLRPGGQILLTAVNVDWTDNTESFGRGLAATATTLVRTRLWPDEVRVASASRLRWRVNGACILAADSLFRRPTLLLPLQFLLAAALLPLAVATNLVSSWRVDRAPVKRVVSSVFIRFRVESVTAASAAADATIDRRVKTGSK